MSAKRIRYESLGEFIRRLENEGELLRITEEVSPMLQITEIVDRVSKSSGGGKALLFENVEGSNLPLLINSFGSEKRMAMSLGVENVEEIAEQISAILNIVPPESIGSKLKSLGMLFDISKFPPKKISGYAPCQEVVLEGGDVDLFKFPILKCWPGDAGRFITLPLVITKSLKGRRNMGMYRLQVFDRNSTGMHWHIHKDGAHHFHEYKKKGIKMPVAVAIGADPAVTFAATAPLPKDIDEFLLAGLIRQKPVKIIKCKTIDLYVPAEAEIILEGYVDPSEDMRVEGPFGDHTGYYSLAGLYPVFHITAITQREKPVYNTTIVGKPPMEDCYMGRATSRIFLPLLKTVTPEVTDYDLPWEGVFHNCVIAAIQKRFPAAAHRVMSAMWGTGQMSFAKMIFAVDEDANVHDYRLMFRTFLNNCDLNEDLFYSKGVLDVLDHSAPEPLYGSKLGIDLTGRVEGETERKLPNLSQFNEKLLADEAKSQGITDYCVPETETKNRMIICAIDKKSQGNAVEAAGNLLSGQAGSIINIVVIVDKGVDPTDLSTVTWKVFNNTDPGRDIIKRSSGLIVDATKKLRSDGYEREWPDEIEMDEKTKKSIDNLWPKLGIK